MLRVLDTRYRYKSIEDFFLSINRVMLSRNVGRIEDLTVQIDSLDCGTLSIAPLGYGITKMSFLYNSYVEYSKLKEFYELANTSTKTTICFDFKANQGCIKSLVLTRDSKGSFKRAKVFFRIADLSKKVLPDLFLIRHILEECPNFEFEGLMLFISQGYLLPAALANTYDTLLGFTLEDLDINKALHRSTLGYIKSSREFDINSHNRSSGGYLFLMEYKYKELNNIPVQPVTYKECKCKLKDIERKKRLWPKRR